MTIGRLQGGYFRPGKHFDASMEFYAVRTVEKDKYSEELVKSRLLHEAKKGIRGCARETPKRF